MTVPPASTGPQRTKRPKPTRAPSTATPALTPTLAPTDTPTVTETPTITDMPTEPPTFGPGTFRPPPLASGLVIEPTEPRLDYTAAPNYGSANLTAGFVPDPYTVGMTSGGPVNVAYLGSSCSGFATSAPDFRISFSGVSSLLRIYFVGTGDATMVVNDPFGNFYCVDDSFGTVNPTIDFNNPSGGTYDVWVGSYASGTFISGTLSVTESSANHP